jgi:hypothetical protein
MIEDQKLAGNLNCDGSVKARLLRRGIVSKRMFLRNNRGSGIKIIFPYFIAKWGGGPECIIFK